MIFGWLGWSKYLLVKYCLVELLFCFWCDVGNCLYFTFNFNFVTRTLLFKVCGWKIFKYLYLNISSSSKIPVFKRKINFGEHESFFFYFFFFLFYFYLFPIVSVPYPLKCLSPPPPLPHPTLKVLTTTLLNLKYKL